MEYLTGINEKEAQSKKQSKSFPKNTLVGLEIEFLKKDTLDLDSQKGLTKIVKNL